MNKALDMLFSTRIMAIFLFIFSISMSIGTILEKLYNTDTAKSLIYNSSWFELIMLFLIICFLKSIKKYSLFKVEKLPSLIFHLSFILIFIGGAISRYISFDGVLSIKEGKDSNEIISSKTFIKLIISKNNFIRYYKIPYLLSVLHNNFSKKFIFNKDIIKLKIINYIPNAKKKFIKNKNGKKFLKIINFSFKNYSENYIEKGHYKKIGLFQFFFYKNLNTLNKNNNINDIKIYEKNKELYIITPITCYYTFFKDKKKYIIKKKTSVKVNHKAIYKIGSISYIIPKPINIGLIKYYSSDNSEEDIYPDVIIAKVSNKKLYKIITFLGKKNTFYMSKNFILGDKKISVGYGSMLINIPFIVHLNKFKLDYYPGSRNPSSFLSEITIYDKKNKINKKIFMNNVINYKGYKIFQSSYNLKKKEVYFFINHDYYGTTVSYIGYFLLFISMFLNFFWKKTHFWKLNYFLTKKLNEKC